MMKRNKQKKKKEGRGRKDGGKAKDYENTTKKEMSREGIGPLAKKRVGVEKKGGARGFTKRRRPQGEGRNTTMKPSWQRQTIEKKKPDRIGRTCRLQRGQGTPFPAGGLKTIRRGKNQNDRREKTIRKD